MGTYKPAIIIGGIAFVIIFFLFGMIVWPFVAWVLGTLVFVPPLVLAFLSFFGIIIVRASKLQKKWIYLALLIPIFVCNALEAAFCANRYDGDKFRGETIYARKIGGGHTLANQFGFNILPSKAWVHGNCYISDDYVVCGSRDGEGIFSVLDKDMVVPFGQTLAKSGHCFSEGSYYGIKTANDVTVIPAKYDDINIHDNFFAVKQNGKWAWLDAMGRHVENTNYPDYETYTSPSNEKYIAFKDGRKYYIVKLSDDGRGNYFYSTTLQTPYKIREVAHINSFVVERDDWPYRFNIMDGDGNLHYSWYRNYSPTDDNGWRLYD